MREGGMSLVTVFGLGHLRPAPGTWGSLPPVVLAGVLIALGLGPDAQPLVYHGVLVLVLLGFSLVCVTVGDAAEYRFGRKDPSQVVADETAGQCLPLLFLSNASVATTGAAVFTLIYAFLAFRVMDIVKPWPAYGMQRAPGGWGILLDDLMAGVYAMIIVQVVSRVMLA